jgi:hypothetical protein
MLPHPLAIADRIPFLDLNNVNLIRILIHVTRSVSNRFIQKIELTIQQRIDTFLKENIASAGISFFGKVSSNVDELLGDSAQ